jgi:hypothetical protein
MRRAVRMETVGEPRRISGSACERCGMDATHYFPLGEWVPARKATGGYWCKACYDERATNVLNYCPPSRDGMRFQTGKTNLGTLVLTDVSMGELPRCADCHTGPAEFYSLVCPKWRTTPDGHRFCESCLCKDREQKKLWLSKLPIKITGGPGDYHVEVAAPPEMLGACH